MKKLFFINQRVKFVLAALVIFLFLSGQNLLAQNEDFTVYWTSHSINSWASNYTPKLNEPVTITVEFEAPQDFNSDELIGYSIEPGMERLSGINMHKGKLKKGEKISFQAVVKFTERKVFDIVVDFHKAIRKYFSIYVDGAFRENKDITPLRYFVVDRQKELETMRKDSLKGRKISYEAVGYNKPFHELKDWGPLSSDLPGGGRPEFNRTSSLRFVTKYDSLNIEAAKKYNLEVLYNDLNKKFNDIQKESRKIFKAVYEKRQALKNQTLQKQNLEKGGIKSKAAPADTGAQIEKNSDDN
jgi:hypothetical protein